MSASYINLVPIKCPSCGANLSLNDIDSIVNCGYCNTTITPLRGIQIDEDDVSSDFSEEERKKFRNMFKIMENSMIAENYKEVYEYCNKLLELDPNSSVVWENKAISAFWLSITSEIIDSFAKEVFTYLQMAHQTNPNSLTLPNTKKAIAEYLYAISRKLLYKIPRTINTQYKTYCGKFLQTDIEKIVKYIRLWETCYEFSKDIRYLKSAVEQLVPAKDAKVSSWDKAITSQSERFPVLSMLDRYIKIIQTQEPNYKPPKKPGIFSL